MQSLHAIPLSESEFEGLRQLVLEYTGISLSPAKIELVKRRFAPRLRALELDTFSAYVNFVKRHPKELSFFSDAITTNLTSFYREKHHFDLLKEELLPGMLKKHERDRRLRFWSAGCSTGQEAYTLGIELFESIPNLRGLDVKILATDLDSKCLRTCKDGVYSQKDLEKVPPDVARRYFDPLPGTPMFRVAQKVQDLVTFKRLNFLDEFPMKGPFDLIICRNVFIYFDKRMQAKVMAKFAKLQQPGDYLFLGHSESVGELTNDYELVGLTTYKRV